MTISEYFSIVEADLGRGNATEHTHRPALKALIESLSNKITAINEPQRIKCGSPDLIVVRGEVPLGYVEAKDINTSLEIAEQSEQLQRYRESLGNLILTDYLEFRWYVRPRPSTDDPFPESEHRLTARLARVGRDSKLRPEADGEEQVIALLNAFLDAKVPTVQSARELAVRMAALARLIRDTIRRAFAQEGTTGTLHAQMKAFRHVLLHDLTDEQFSDMYAQTICYGLFAARCNAQGSEHFTREHAAYDLPKTNPFLRKMFNHIAGPDLDERIAWAVDDLAELLHHANIGAILEDFGKRTRREDPVVHFYETFLAAYDPRMREARGVYYTPEPVVSYIVRSVDHILKTDFKLRDGLADSSKIAVRNSKGKVKTDSHKVLILDPATGTGTFLYGVINEIFEGFKKNLGMWSGYVSEHLLPRLFGFELLMAPYAVAHMKLGLLLEETGYDFKLDERLRVYLTNTLEEAHEYSGLPLFAAEIAEEANEASKIKQEKPVMVVIGNPPYAVSSANTGQWITELLRGKDKQTAGQVTSYFKVDGKALGERNPKMLNDDYVKFIRFAQWRIAQTGYGVLSFITNHGYLDNPTFRGMRQSLMATFDELYVLDLHGNSNKKETAPDGSKDQNVFDIQQGVAIGIFIKQGVDKKSPPIVRHAELWGLRAIYEQNSAGQRVLSGGKYYWLGGHDVSSTQWTTLEPQSPSYLFIPQRSLLKEEYEQWPSINEIFEVGSSCMNTARDSLVIDVDKKRLEDRIGRLVDEQNDIDQLQRELNVKTTPWWDFNSAVTQLRKSTTWKNSVIECLYRPFDQRWLYHDPTFIDRPRKQVNSHMTRRNLSLVTTRQTKEEFGTVVTRLICGQHKIAAVYDRSYFFPLYVYNSGEGELFEKPAVDVQASPRPNLTFDFISQLLRRLELAYHTEGDGGDRLNGFGPEDVFDYIYAVFYSPTYRSRYAELLKTGFPRLPLTSSVELFRKLCALGSRLVALHLMELPVPQVTTYPISGSNEVIKVRYTAPGDAVGRGSSVDQ